MTSPAVQASDSANRRRTENRPSESRMLTSSQNSTSRRSRGTARNPSSAFQADTTAIARIAGSSTPAARTVESSAAKIDSASSNHRSEISAERGSTSIDLGPTKILADQESPRRSGGGQPEVGQFNPESTQRSRSTSNRQPSLVAERGFAAVAPRSQTSSSSSAIEPAAEATAMARKGGDEPLTAERDAAVSQGDFSNQGTTDLAEQLADSRQRAQRDAEESAESDDEDDEEERRRGNERTRIAKAPITRGESGFGNARADRNRNIADSERAVDDPSESLATALQRRATSAVPGAGISRSATTLLMQAATTLPVIDKAGSARKENRRTVSLSNNSNLQPTEIKSVNPGRSPSRAQPRLSDDATSKLPTNRIASNARANDELDSANVAIEKPDVTDQQQGAALEIVAIEGPAGLAEKPDIALGVMTRPASRDSVQIQPDLDNRFRKTRFGGTPAINPDAVLAKNAFRQRTPAAVSRGAEPTTEAAILLGLEFLVRHQSMDGSWSLGAFDQQQPQSASQLNSDTAATGLALLAFQGAGYNHREFKYARQVNHGLQWLIENQQSNGCLYISVDKKSDSACRLYSHGIAALALTEAYGMTQDEQIRAAAQKALDYIAESQDPRKGGWRYFDSPAMKSSDTSVTGWMLMALQSGRLSGLKIDPVTFDRIDQWLGVAADPDDESVYRYNPFAVDSDGVSRIQGRQPSVSMTAVGLLMRIYRGWGRQDARLLKGAAYLVEQQLPGDATARQRDTYYWYYATQVLKHVDGPLWDQWNSRLRPLLIQSQVKAGDMAGSWHPYNPVPDRWGAFGGRLYVTTMNLLSLEVRHRLLPLYQKTNDKP